MKSRHAAMLISLIFLCRSSFAADVNTAFTYQGELNYQGNPAHGAFDFEFKLFDVDLEGTELADSVMLSNVMVVDGIFSVELDFGSAPFALKKQLWLQIAVRDGGSLEDYVSLSPRQKITPAPFAISALETCASDSVAVGDACVDKYEASVWQTTDVGTIEKIQSGLIESAEDLSGLAIQHGVKVDDYDTGCSDDANGCLDYFAVSIAGVYPADTITWFQAAAACRNSGKRLATNQEWQLAALGTPDTGTDDGTSDCRLTGSATIQTGSRASCVSDTGAFDMVGNLWEWVADWWPAVISSDGSGCTSGWGAFSDDYNCAAINVTTAGPAAVLRGGDAWASGGNTKAGPFAIALTRAPQSENFNVGFRCAKNL